MTSRTRRIVLWLSAPVVVFAVLGGFLSKATAREETYQHLKVYEEVVQLISNQYVEKVDGDKVMLGALTGLADSLDPDSAFLSSDQVKQIEANAPVPTGDVGLDLTRQYYLRVIAARDGSSAAKAGLRTGDYIRSIGDNVDAQHVGVRGDASAPRRARHQGEADGDARRRGRTARHRAGARSGAGGRRERPHGERRRRLSSRGIDWRENRRRGEIAGGRSRQERRLDHRGRRPPDVGWVA